MFCKRRRGLLIRKVQHSCLACNMRTSHVLQRTVSASILSVVSCRSPRRFLYSVVNHKSPRRFLYSVVNHMSPRRFLYSVVNHKNPRRFLYSVVNHKSPRRFSRELLLVFLYRKKTS